MKTIRSCSLTGLKKKGGAGLTQDDVQGCSDRISDPMNRAGHNICRAWRGGQIIKQHFWQFLHSADICSLCFCVSCLTSRYDSKWQHRLHWFHWRVGIQLSSEHHGMAELCHWTVPTDTHHPEGRGRQNSENTSRCFVLGSTSPLVHLYPAGGVTSLQDHRWGSPFLIPAKSETQEPTAAMSVTLAE